MVLIVDAIISKNKESDVQLTENKHSWNNLVFYYFTLC